MAIVGIVIWHKWIEIMSHARGPSLELPGIKWDYDSMMANSYVHDGCAVMFFSSRALARNHRNVELHLRLSSSHPSIRRVAGRCSPDRAKHWMGQLG